MQLRIKEVLDYIKCPQRHTFQWQQGIDVSVGLKGSPNRWYVVEYYDHAIHQVIYSMLHQYADDRYPSPHYMKQRWGATWNKGRTKEDILNYTKSWRDEIRKREKMGLKALLELHSDFQNDAGTPILIGKEYTVPIGAHTLVGTLELVRETKNEEGKSILEIVDFKTEDKTMNLHIKGDLEVTAASYAFRHLFGHTEDRVSYHGLQSRTQQHTKRDEKDFELLAHVVDNVARAIESGIHYPVLNSRCYECPFQKVCEKREWY